MTQFYIDGKWVELDELVEKAKKWDVVSASHRKYLGTGTYGAIKKLEAIKELCHRYTAAPMMRGRILGIIEGSEFTTKDEDEK